MIGLFLALLAPASAQDAPAPAPDATAAVGITAPEKVDRAQLIEPIAQLMSDRTKALVALPGTALIEWDGMGTVKIGDFVDIWTRSPRGVCLAAPRVQVVLGPDAEGDARHGAPVLRVPTAMHAPLQKLTYAAWTPRRADDPRDYPELACK